MLALQGSTDVEWIKMPTQKPDHNHHVWMIVGVPVALVDGWLREVQGPPSPSVLGDIVKHVDPAILSIPGVSVVGVVAGEFTVQGEIDLDHEVHRRRAHLVPAHGRFLSRIQDWWRIGHHRRQGTDDEFLRRIVQAVRTYVVTSSSYPLVPEKPDSPLPEDLTKAMNRMRSDTMVGVLRWIVNKLHDRQRITRALLERVEFEVRPKPKGGKPTRLDW